MFSAYELIEKVKKAIRKIRKSHPLSDIFPSLYDDISIPSACLTKVKMETDKFKNNVF